jgi:hypothetical protein
MFNPAFSQSHLETLVPGMVEETLVFVDLLNDAAKGGDVLLMLDALTVSASLPEAYDGQLLTFDIIGRLLKLSLG